MAQVSIQAFGFGGRFWDLDFDEAVESLAVAFFRRSREGSERCILPACTSDLITVSTGPPKAKKGGGFAGLVGVSDGL